MRRMRILLARLGEWLFCGYEGSAPNDWARSPHFKSRQRSMSAGHEWNAIWFTNDAHDVDIYCKYTDSPDWVRLLMLSSEDFRKLAIWYLWRWAWGEWFGLRRKAFYWRNRRIVTPYLKRKA